MTQCGTSSGGAWQPVSGPSGPTGPRPPRPTRQRGWVRIVLGALGLLTAGALLVGGFVVLIGAIQWDAADAEAEGTTPGAVVLDADDGEKYVVALGASWGSDQSISFNTDFALDMRCTVTHPDGSTDELDGDRQVSATTRGGRYASIGSFEGEGGETAVECASTDTTVLGDEVALPFIVHDRNATLRAVWIGLFVAGVLVGLVAAALLAWGLVGRPARPTSA